jgi:hypothetical protein
MKPIVIYKWFDLIIQVVYFPTIIIFYNVEFASQLLKHIYIHVDDSFIIGSYILFGAIQIISNIIHVILQQKIILSKRRNLYNIITIIVFIASIFFILLFKLEPRIDNHILSIIFTMLAFPLIFTSPFWAIYYFILSVKELNWLRHENK